MKTPFSLSDFDFSLPEELIAQHPATERSASRLLDGRSPSSIDRRFTELPELLQPGDLLVFNDTRVVKARLFGNKSSGGRLELLIERVLSVAGDAANEVAAHMKVSKKPLPGAVMQMDGGFTATLLGRWPNADGPLYRFRLSDDPYALMAQHGHVPLPPYITHSDSPDDEQRYQTVFAKNPGAVAAPTAALHFDETVLAQLEARGVQRAHVTLHVGAGTFQPVKTENIRSTTSCTSSASKCRRPRIKRWPSARHAAGACWRSAQRPCAHWSQPPDSGPTATTRIFSSRPAFNLPWWTCC